MQCFAKFSISVDMIDVTVSSVFEIVHYFFPCHTVKVK